MRAALASALAGVVLVAGCRRADPPKQYALTGQILAVYDDRQELAIRHDDIPGYMPAMTMSFPVAAQTLMIGRTPGELVKATLEVDGLTGTLVAIGHVGTAPLPDTTNAIAMAGGILDVGDALPDAALVDQRDARRSLSEWRGTPLLVTFIYTRCPLPNFCPLMDQHLASIQKALASDAALTGRLRLVSISFDPDFDTPAVLAAHATKVAADPAVWTFLTGDRITVDRLAAKLGVGVIRGATTDAEVTHNLRTGLFDANGILVKMYPGSDWSPRTVVADLRGILGR